MCSLYFFAALLFLSFASAQQTCTGVLSSPPLITSDVNVPAGATCTLSGVNVTGSVMLMRNSALATTGTTRVFGTISGTNCGSMFLGGVLAVSGGVSADSCRIVDVGPRANVGSLMTTDVRQVIVQGTVALLNIGGNAALTINGGSVLGGGVSRQNAVGPTSLCGATILGGIKLQNVEGNLLARASRRCPKSDISGTIELSNTKGRVDIGGGMLLGADFIASIHDGPIRLSDTHLSDVSINQVNGPLDLRSVVVDSDATISSVRQSIMVTRSSFDGDFSLTRNPGTVNIARNDFTLEDILITNNGFVSIRNNANFSFAASENGGVEVLNNDFITTASVNKNKGITRIRGNSFTTLSCTDNQQVAGAGNSVMFGTGQCSQL